MTFNARQRYAFAMFQYHVHWNQEAKARAWFAKIGYDFPYEVGIHALQHLKGNN